MINNSITNPKYHNVVIEPQIVAIIMIIIAIKFEVYAMPSPPTNTAISICPTKKFKIMTSINPANK